MGFPDGSVVNGVPANAGDLGSIPGSGRSPAEGNGNPLQYSCLENPMDRGAWQATVHRVTKSWIQLKWLSTHTCTPISVVGMALVPSHRGMMKMRSKGCGDCLVSGESVIVEVVVNCSFLEFTLLQWWWLPWPFLPLGHKVRFTLTLPKRPNLHRHEETSLAGT